MCTHSDIFSSELDTLTNLTSSSNSGCGTLMCVIRQVCWHSDCTSSQLSNTKCSNCIFNLYQMPQTRSQFCQHEADQMKLWAAGYITYFTILLNNPVMIYKTSVWWNWLYVLLCTSYLPYTCICSLHVREIHILHNAAPWCSVFLRSGASYIGKLSVWLS